MKLASANPSWRSYVSSPIHTEVSQREVKPTNQTSDVRLDVPVLPAAMIPTSRIGLL